MILFGFSLLPIGAVSLGILAEETPEGSDILEPDRLKYLEQLTMDDILNTEVVTASRHPERLFRSAAAVTVISGDEIRRSGARTIPDALRLAPGMEVGQISANTWGGQRQGVQQPFCQPVAGDD